MCIFTISKHKITRLSTFVVLLVALSGCGGTTSTTSDTTRPTFAGITGSSSLATSITLNWGLASDNITAAQNIVYLVYRANATGAENFTTPTYTTAAGALSFTDSGLTAGSTYYYVVRAKDEAGNIDTNTIEVQVNTDITAPTFSGATVATPGSTTMTIAWNAASDNITAPSGIVYLIYRASTSGGQNYTTPTATTTAGALTYSDSGLAANTTYYYVVRARDQAGNINTNTTQVFATTVIDNAAPTFAGATGATAQNSSSIAVGWSAASDTVTAQGNIVYLIYRATTSGTQDLSNPTPTATTAAGATSYTDSGLAASTTYYYVVRARDENGNINMNTAEVSAMTIAPSPDSTPPTFAGASSLTVQSGTSVTINWSAASDNFTDPSAIVYLVYRSSTITMNYSSPLVTTVAGATSYVDNSTTKSYYVVRAKDIAGNIDTNTAQVFGPVSFSNDIYTPLFVTCASAGCHGGGAGSLTMTSAVNAWTNLVGVDALQCGTAKKYVAAGSSSTSYLIDKLTTSSTLCSGSQMPLGQAAFSTLQLNTVKAWIDQGALNN